ncbi:hypothetical protein GCM10027073_32900 [Streptomyces chlorus]|uniref:DUF3293 domain-containing protein n=1 Tax=Streptomyces chlorus TaxID=887452 RepID=A0ABW1E3Z8_9ACTN
MHATDASSAPQNWELYRHAVVDIHFQDRTVRVEPRSSGTAEGSFPEQAGNAALHVITAWNPHGRTASAEHNARVQGLLLDELDRQRLTWWPAAGGDACGTHVEESVAVAGLSDGTARELGRRFGQETLWQRRRGNRRIGMRCPAAQSATQSLTESHVIPLTPSTG